MKIPDAMNAGFQNHWNNSFPGGTSCEQGGTLVWNAKGQMEMILPERACPFCQYQLRYSARH